MQNILKEKLGAKFNIFVLEIVAVTVVIIALTVVRILGGNLYLDIKNWYSLRFCGETRISEVIEEDKHENSKIDDTQTLNTDESGVINVSAQVYKSSKSRETENCCNSLYFPLDYAQLTSRFGDRVNPVTHIDERHKGVDMATEENSPIYAAADGVVIYAAPSPTYGNYMIIDHGQGLKTLYAHCNKLLRGEGDKVSRGEKIALVGSTGQSTAPHLHFEVRVNDKYINPEWLLNW